ncbi:ATP-grasp domain-containing protein [Desulfurococcus mucosus]|uniref:SSU ribosomal protein S6P modification protein n=1 Tax=Desulfurococcus mucosus (strain ATCC 35584 / DSM 2162 / JCM 9187 / O7/1) TaxID=765177 RepID=E8RA37_DESM0|nr:RimK family alpha-L-glutamate ligase [Desulfurococcus mucosus]ADV65363.1 SSU ribosomal protein S6P modification protein [Desulfurococcus mucosus DSM 2162]
MRIAVVDYKKEPRKGSLELLDSISRHGHEAVYLKTPMLDATVSRSGVKVYYSTEEVRVDAAILRGLGFITSLEALVKRIGVLEALASLIPVVNDPSRSLVARDKWRCLLHLHLKGLPVPETLVTENPFTAMRYVREKQLVVYKPLMGSLGLGSTLIHDPDLAFNVTRGLMNIGQPSYYQVFLDKPGYDYRVFVVGGRVIGAMKRVNPYSWKTNVAQGAGGVAVKESEEPEVYELGLKAVEALGLDYAGVDVAYDKATGGYYILEVNAFPQWEGLRSATGVNPPDHIVEYVVEKARK